MRNRDLLITALAPAIWGSTYIVTTELLPDGYPLTVGLLRALPAGLILLLLVRRLPEGIWWLRVTVLGALNFGIFFWLLFEAAYRLPGGVAATVGALQPLLVLFLARIFLGQPVLFLAVVAALAGVGGVALLVLTPDAAFDPLGIAAGFAGALSMACGTVLTRRWQPPVSALTFTAWQMTAGGVLLAPAAFLLEPSLPALSVANWSGFLYLGIVGGAFSYLVWIRGIARLEPSAVAPLGLLSPTMAVILGWSLLGQSLGIVQMIGVVVVLASVWGAQRVQRSLLSREQSKNLVAGVTK